MATSTETKYSLGGFLTLILLAGCGSSVGYPTKYPGLLQNQPSDSSPTWSPDGASIAYAHYPGESEPSSTRGIWIVAASGAGRHQVLGGIWGYPDWSPDGKHLVISGIGIYSITPSGDSLHPITAKTGFQPRWSPDGTQLAFQFFDTTSTPWHSTLWLVSADGTGLRPLPQPSTDGWGEPDWSPNGTQLVHTRWVPADNPPEIFVMDTTGQGEQQLTMDSYEDRGPSWSPDGNWIAWSSRRTAAGPELWLMNADGTGAHAIAAGTGPAWSPDSRKIVFSQALTDNTVRLFTFDMSTQRVQQLTR